MPTRSNARKKAARSARGTLSHTQPVNGSFVASASVDGCKKLSRTVGSIRNRSKCTVAACSGSFTRWMSTSTASSAAAPADTPSGTETRYCRCALSASNKRTECRIAARLSQPAAIFPRPSPRVFSDPRSTSGQSIALAASAIPANARCCAGVVGPTAREYSRRRPAASKLRNRTIAFCSCTTAARFAMRRRERPFGGSLFRTSLTSGKGNKAGTLRLRSDDTGQASWLGSALHAELWGFARAART